MLESGHFATFSLGHTKLIVLFDVGVGALLEITIIMVMIIIMMYLSR